MLTTTSSIASASRPNVFQRLMALSPVFDGVSLVILPSLVALLVSAAIIGHGHISAASILDVFDTMAKASVLPAISP